MHGYRFVAAVKRLIEEPVPLIVEKHSRSRIIAVEHEVEEPRSDTEVQSLEWGGETTNGAAELSSNADAAATRGSVAVAENAAGVQMPALKRSVSALRVLVAVALVAAVVVA